MRMHLNPGQSAGIAAQAEAVLAGQSREWLNVHNHPALLDPACLRQFYPQFGSIEKELQAYWGYAGAYAAATSRLQLSEDFCTSQRYAERALGLGSVAIVERCFSGVITLNKKTFAFNGNRPLLSLRSQGEISQIYYDIVPHLGTLACSPEETEVAGRVPIVRSDLPPHRNVSHLLRSLQIMAA